MSLQDSLYQQDYYTWLSDTVNKLKLRKFDEIDINTLVGEIESMAKNNERELTSRFIILLTHLLKWEYQPIHTSLKSREAIRKQRWQIELMLTQSPSLKAKLEELTDSEKLYKKVLKMVLDDTGLDFKDFPFCHPYSIEEILDTDFYPDNRCH